MIKKAKILICDDEKGVRESFGFILKEKYEVSFAADGLQALRQIKNQQIDLILLDLKMPKMDGIKVLKEAKKLNPQIKVIVVTGYSSVATAYRAVKSGAANYITKPFDKDEIIRAIEKLLKE